jgi:hypothetical protein
LALRGLAIDGHEVVRRRGSPECHSILAAAN